jgi:hypothetical protein
MDIWVVTILEQETYVFYSKKDAENFIKGAKQTFDEDMYIEEPPTEEDYTLRKGKLFDNVDIALDYFAW